MLAPPDKPSASGRLSHSRTTDKTRAANLICRERKKKPACLEGEQAGVNAARQMCREFNLQIELSGHQDSEGETGKSGES